MSKDHDQISLSESGGNPKVRLETSPAMPHAHDPKRRRRRSRLGDPGLHSVYVFHRTASHKQGIVRHWSTTKRELGEKSPSSMDREHSYRLDLKKSANPGSCTDGATVIKNLRADLATGSVNLPCEIIPDKPARTGSPRDYFPRICEHYSVARLPGRTRVSSQKGRILQAVKPDQSHGGRFTIHVDLTGTPRKHDTEKFVAALEKTWALARRVFVANKPCRRVARQITRLPWGHKTKRKRKSRPRAWRIHVIIILHSIYMVVASS